MVIEKGNSSMIFLVLILEKEDANPKTKASTISSSASSVALKFLKKCITHNQIPPP